MPRRRGAGVNCAGTGHKAARGRMQSCPARCIKYKRKLRMYIRNLRLYIRKFRLYIRNLRIYFSSCQKPLYVLPNVVLLLMLPALCAEVRRVMHRDAADGVRTCCRCYRRGAGGVASACSSVVMVEKMPVVATAPPAVPAADMERAVAPPCRVRWPQL